MTATATPSPAATNKPAGKTATKACVPSRLSRDDAAVKHKPSGQQVGVIKAANQVAAAPLQQFTFVNLDTIRKGVLAKKVLTVSRRMNLTKGQVMEALKFPPSTIDRKISQNERLTPEQTERFVGLESLIDQVQAIVEESGDPTGFDAAKWLGEWLEQPLPALGGHKPSEYMDTVTGQQYISSLIARMQSGAYA